MFELPNEQEPTQWKELLTYGNECYKKQDFMQAEYYYKKAEEYLDYLWLADPANVNLLMAWISSLHNLATLFEQQGNNILGLQHLLIPHHRMLNLSQSNKVPENVKIIAINALKLTFTPILMYTKRHPICEKCQHEIESFEESLKDNQSFVH